MCDSGLLPPKCIFDEKILRFVIERVCSILPLFSSTVPLHFVRMSGNPALLLREYNYFAPYFYILLYFTFKPLNGLAP